METKELAGEKTVQLLWNQANTLPQENHTAQLLRSFYLTNCKKITRHDIKLPADKFAPSVMCPKCSSIWTESKFSLTLKPFRTGSHKAEKLVEKLTNDQKSLSRKQKKRAKWLKKKQCNNVEVTCEFCKQKTRQTLIRPKVKPKVEENEPQIDIQLKKKKKKKSKDKSAGLKLAKAIPQPQIKKSNPPAKKENKQKTQPPKPKAKIEKTISKTQKQNSLLQLAKMLKTQGPAVGSKTSQLEKMLR